MRRNTAVRTTVSEIFKKILIDLMAANQRNGKKNFCILMRKKPHSVCSFRDYKNYNRQHQLRLTSPISHHVIMLLGNSSVIPPLALMVQTFMVRNKESIKCLIKRSTDLRLPKKKSANGQKCFSYRGAKIWNSLLAESKTASSLDGFKKTVKG